MQSDAASAEGFGGFVADRGVAFLCLGLHRDLVAEGGGDGVVGAQVDGALIAVHHDEVAVQRLGRDAAGADHQRDRQCAGDDSGMRADGAFFQHDAAQAATIVQQFGGADVAGHENGIGGHFRPCFLALSGQDAQQAVREVVQIVKAVAQVGVGHLLHPVAGVGLFLFHRGFGGQAAGDVLLHPAHPALGMGEHAVGLQHFGLVLVAIGGGQQFIDAQAQLAHGLVQAFQFLVRVLGDRVGHDDAGFVQPDMAFGGTFLRCGAADQDGLLVAGGEGGAFALKGAEFGHFGKDHGDDFEGVDLVAGEFAGFFRLDDQNAQFFTKSLDGDAEEGGIDLFPGFGHEAEALFLRGVGGVDDAAGAGDAADETFAQFHARLVDGFCLEALGRAEFKGFGVAEKVDGADFGAHRIGGQMRDLVQPGLTRAVLGHGVAQPAQQLAAFGFGLFGHMACLVPRPVIRWSKPACRSDRQPGRGHRSPAVRPISPTRRHHAAPARQVPCISCR